MGCCWFIILVVEGFRPPRTSNLFVVLMVEGFKPPAGFSEGISPSCREKTWRVFNLRGCVKGFQPP